MQAETQNTLAEAKLLFEIQHPTYDSVWLEGYDYAVAQGEEDDNPYEHGSREYQFWADGWWAGCYGEQPLFDLAGNTPARDAAGSPVVNTNKTDKVEVVGEIGRISGKIIVGGALLALCYDLLE